MTWRPTTAFVLAAGLGTRMRPLTDHLPKPLVELAGRALIDHVLDRLAAAGIHRAVVNVHYLADQIEAHLAARASRGEGPATTISDERGLLLDTGGGVLRALPMLGAEPFVVHNSDSVWIEGAGSNLGRLFSAWDNARMDALMLVTQVNRSIGYEGAGDFAMSADGRLVRRGASDRAPYVFTGVSIAHPRLFDGAPQGAFSLNRPWDSAIATGRLYGVPMEGLWMHVGDPGSLSEAERIIADDHAG
mgnify:CR=1 FL=1